MKRRVPLYVLGSVAVAALAAAAAVCYVLGPLALGILGTVVAVFSLIGLATVIAQDNLNLRCGTLCAEKRYGKERALIEKKMRSPLFFLIRTVALTRYIRVCMALDDLPTARRYIDSLRHGGGTGWKYKTAFFFILIRLDEGDIQTARTEYEEFRTQCAHAKIYAEQIEVLTAIFHRLFGTNNNEPLPAAAADSPFPVIGRILGRVYEARAAASDTDWGE